MNFLHPNFLWAGFFLAIPVIVHLFNFRKYRKEYFSNISILKAVVSQTQKTSQLKKRLILASRILAFLCIILAFVQPFLNSNSGKSTSSQSIVSIYIDNSFSMQAPASSIAALEEAKLKANELLSSADNFAQIQILTNDFKNNELQLNSIPEAKEIINSIEISHQRRNSTDIWQKQLKTTSITSTEDKLFYWISDFQRYQVQSIQESEYPLHCIPILHSKLRNIFIDTAYIYSPNLKLNQEVNIIYRVQKSREDASKTSLISLSQNEQIKLRKEIIWGDKLTYTDTFVIKTIDPNWQKLSLTVADQSIDFDNQYYFSYYISPKPYVSVVNGNVDQQFISSALKADENFDIHTFPNSNLSIDEIKNSNLIILNQSNLLPHSSQIQTWLHANKNVVIIPSFSVNIQNYNLSLTQLGLQNLSNIEKSKARISQLNIQDNLFQNLFSTIEKTNDYPSVNSYFSLSGYTSRSKEVLISLDNGKPLLVKYSKLGEGTIYLFLASLEASNSDFVYSSIFAPMMYKLGSMSRSHQVNSYIMAPNTVVSIPIESKSQDMIYKIMGKDISIIPFQRKAGNILSFTIPESMNTSGFYNLVDANDSKSFELAINHSRDEAKMDFLSEDELKDKLNYKNLLINSSKAEYLKNLKPYTSSNLWIIWTILAVIFFIIEMIMILFWKQISLKLKLA